MSCAPWRVARLLLCGSPATQPAIGSQAPIGTRGEGHEGLARISGRSERRSSDEHALRPHTAGPIASDLGADERGPAAFSDVTGALALAVAVAVVYLCTHYAFVFWTVAALAGGSTLLGCVSRAHGVPRLSGKCSEHGPENPEWRPDAGANREPATVRSTGSDCRARLEDRPGGAGQAR